MKISLVVGIFLTVINTTTQNLVQNLKTWENYVRWAEKSQAQRYYQLVKDALQTEQYDKTHLRLAYRIYAYYLMYGLDMDATDRIDYTKVHYYAKQSADLGDPNAQTLLGLLGSFKLDGHFALQANIEQMAYDKIDDGQVQIDLSKYRRLEQYLKYRHLSAPLIDLYFAALQGDDQAALAIGYKYMRGLGMEANCSNAALFMQPILQKHFIDQPSKEKYIYQNRRIDHMLYNTEYLTLQQQQLDQEYVQIFEQLDLITRESVTDVIQLAYNYLYGSNGVKRNYNKAYELFAKVVMDTDNHQAKGFMAQMIVEGIAPENDMDLAFRLFKEGAYHNDSRSYNGLGYMYLNGISVEKNVKKALVNFQKAAELGNPDGHYNYGALHLLPSSKDIDRNKRVAYNHLNIASAQGHALAQFSLALLYLDGVDFYYSCDLAVRLMHQASTRLFPSRHVRIANDFFQKGLYSQALAKYLQAAMLGYQSALANSAILADQFDAVTNEDIRYDLLNEKLNGDDFFQFSRINSIPLKQTHDPFAYLMNEYIQIAGDENTSYEERYNIILELALPKRHKYKNIGLYIANKLYGYCKLEQDGYCFLRFGDFFYHGKSEQQNLIEALRQYRLASEMTDTPPVIQAHAHFNLGYMAALGLGKEKNITLALHHFNSSLYKNPIFPILTPDMLLHIVEFFGTSMEQEEILNKLVIIKDKLIEYLWGRFQYYEKMIMCLSLSSAAIFVLGLKIKLKNIRNLHQ